MKKKIKKSYQTLEKEIVELRKSIEDRDERWKVRDEFIESVKNQVNKILDPELGMYHRSENHLKIGEYPAKFIELLGRIKSLEKDIHVSGLFDSNMYHLLRVALKDPTIGSEEGAHEDRIGSIRNNKGDAF